VISDRAASNLAIAQKFYDGYHGSVERGRLENAFDQADFAEDWIFFGPFIGTEMPQTHDTFLSAGAVANHATIWKRIPNYNMDDFRAWPTDYGCAWRWRVNGRGVDGRDYEFWEQLFIWTDEAGKVTRFEFYDDWRGFAQALSFAYDQPIDEVTHIAGYGAPPWTPAAATHISPAPPPRRTPPENERVARNLAIAEAFFDGYHRSVERGRVETAFDKSFFADSWVLFSPWSGERVQPPGTDYGTVADFEHKKIWRRLPDYKMDDFEAWPTEDGCAWRWRVNGHSAEGVYYEFWEQVFIDTDEAGKIVRMEFYDDWQGFPQTLGFITGLTIDQLWSVEAYHAWVMAGS
jgi:uncharacterized protein YuzE